MFPFRFIAETAVKWEKEELAFILNQEHVYCFLSFKSSSDKLLQPDKENFLKEVELLAKLCYGKSFQQN